MPLEKHQKSDGRFLIDILVSRPGTGSGDIDVAVTNGRSDRGPSLGV